MKAYKKWHDIRYYIGKDTTATHVTWTTDSKEAISFSTFWQAARFFFDTLGFSINASKYDPLLLE
jgi:hypothetical protein